MSAWTVDSKIGLPVIAFCTIVLVIFFHTFAILQWMLPAISCIALIMLFTTTEKGKRIWEIPGVAHVGWCFGILTAVFVALSILLPDDRTEPAVEELIGEIWFHSLKYLLVLFVMVAGLGTAGWQMWRASRKLSAAGELVCGIFARIAAIVAWGVMLIVASLWLLQSPPILRAINQAIQ